MPPDIPDFFFPRPSYSVADEFDLDKNDRWFQWGEEQVDALLLEHTDSPLKRLTTSAKNDEVRPGSLTRKLSTRLPRLSLMVLEFCLKILPVEAGISGAGISASGESKLVAVDEPVGIELRSLALACSNPKWCDILSRVISRPSVFVGQLETGDCCRHLDGFLAKRMAQSISSPFGGSEVGRPSLKDLR